MYLSRSAARYRRGRGGGCHKHTTCKKKSKLEAGRSAPCPPSSNSSSHGSHDGARTSCSSFMPYHLHARRRRRLPTPPAPHTPASGWKRSVRAESKVRSARICCDAVHLCPWHSDEPSALEAGLSRAAEAAARASKLLRWRSGVRRRGPSLRVVQGGGCGAVLGEVGRHIFPPRQPRQRSCSSI